MPGIKIKNDGTVTRPTIPNDPRNPSNFVVDGGYTLPPSETIEIPECGIFESDEAVVLLFRDVIGFDVRELWEGDNPVRAEKPQVIFAGGERWALSKKKIPPLDSKKQIILPAINVRRTDLTFAVEEQKRGMSDKTGNIVIKRKLDKSIDRDYQNFLNKSNLRNVATAPSTANTQTGVIESSMHDAADDPIIAEGGLLQPELGNNAYEVLHIPMPKFYVATYEVTFWTSYISHMNYMMETLYSSMLIHEKAFKLVTPAGYWFMGTFDDVATNSSNFEDYKEDRRIIRYTFTIKVKGFILPPQKGATANPVRRWVFAPRLNFDILEKEGNYIDKEKLLKQESARNSAVMVPDNQDGHLPLFSIGKDTQPDPEEAQTPQYGERVLMETTAVNPKTKTKETLYVTEKTRYDRRSETVTQYSSKKAMEEMRNAAMLEKLKRLKSR